MHLCPLLYSLFMSSEHHTIIIRQQRYNSNIYICIYRLRSDADSLNTHDLLYVELREKKTFFAIGAVAEISNQLSNLISLNFRCLVWLPSSSFSWWSPGTWSWWCRSPGSQGSPDNSGSGTPDSGLHCGRHYIYNMYPLFSMFFLAVR